MRSRVAEVVVSPDSRDVLADKPFADALGRLTRPTPLLTAPAGFLGEPPGLLPPDLVAMWTDRIPQLRPQLVPAVNHYTILFGRQGAAAVARAITTTAA
jgi:lipase